MISPYAGILLVRVQLYVTEWAVSVRPASAQVVMTSAVRPGVFHVQNALLTSPLILHECHCGIGETWWCRKRPVYPLACRVNFSLDG